MSLIYLPIELQLKIIREDLETIKNHLMPWYANISPPKECAECKEAKEWGAGTCVDHAPELNMYMSFSME